MRRFTASAFAYVLAGLLGLVSVQRSPVWAQDEFSRGGTLHLVMVNDAQQNLDPDKEYYAPTWELFRCCLLRTLLSYNGQPTVDGGAKLFPDLAAGMPEVSPDGMTWTFHIKPGIHYAPPFSDVEVTAGDFIRALNREADPIASSSPGYPFYYSVIAGFDDALAGPTQNISGLDAPNPSTLVVKLTEPAGDLGYRFSLPATAPIPPSPTDPGAPEGAAQGLAVDFGHHLISTGPYMLEGSEGLDFNKLSLLQPGVAGYQAGRSIMLVRNPSWDPSTDSLRPAYVDRMEIRITPNPMEWSPTQFNSPSIQRLARAELQRFAKQVDAGTVDLVFDVNAPLSQVNANSQDPALMRDASNRVRYLSMNLAVPPFNDIHVRRALNYAIDKGALIDALGKLGLEGQPADHLVPDSVENGLLTNYDPYPTSLAGARSEMKLSTYDTNGDGRCDATACQSVSFALWSEGSSVDQARWLADVRSDLGHIGIHLAPSSAPTDYTPSDRVGLQFGADSSWQADYPSGWPFTASLFGGSSIVGKPTFRNPNNNLSLTGATSKELEAWGYTIRKTPSLDGWIDACQPETGEAQAQCWAEVDQYPMQEIIPAVPISFDQTVRVVSSRVQNYSIDQFTGLPALDHIAIAG
jgi:peptide/nickel transport system substrate-binding protein